MAEGERHISHGGRQVKRACAGKLPFFKPPVLVHFHSADKDIPETGQFTEETGLMFNVLTVPHGWGGLVIMAECKKEQLTCGG